MLPRLTPSHIALAGGLLLGPVFAASPGAAEPPAGDSAIVELPPFVITETTTGKPWRFAEADGFEIVSQSDDEATQQVFAALWRGRRLALPPALLSRIALPTAVIVFDQTPDKGSAVQSMGSAQALHEISSHWTNVIKRTIADREFFCVNLHGRYFRYSSTFRFDLRTLLALHTPPAPPWLIVGLFGSAYGVYREGIGYKEGSQWAEVLRGQWCSAAEWQKAEGLLSAASVRAETPPAKRRGIETSPSPVAGFVTPPAELWNGGLLPGQPAPAAHARWAATCALFARWGIFGESGGHYDGFWRFAARACAEPVTEALLRECLGVSYAELHDELGWHLPIAVGEPAARKIAPLKPPRLSLRPATAADLARTRGDWERAEASLLAERFPDIAAKYRDRAGRTLRNGHTAAANDLRLAAALGLYEHEVGHDGPARELLAAAVAGGQARPCAGFTLAHLRFREATAAAGPSDRLDAAQTATILLPLYQAMEQPPALVNSYELLAEVWRRSAKFPAEEAIRRLGDGQRNFPRHPRLLLATLRACLERGERRAALAFIERALPLVIDAELRSRLDKARTGLLQALAATPGATP